MTAARRRAFAPRALLALLVLAVAFTLSPADATGPSTGQKPAAVTPKIPPKHYLPPVKHVFVINIENKGYTETWGDESTAPYLAKTLRDKGVLMNYYYGTAHNSLPNYLAQISGQAPNAMTQSDCQTYAPFTSTGPMQAPQQAVGAGCVYPKKVRTLPRELTKRGLTWKGYMQQMRKPCDHPVLGSVDPTQQATAKQNYAVRHNPFMYFKSITGHEKYCKSHVRPLHNLRKDLRRQRTTPNLSYITPDLCSDGHDNPCANGDVGGLVKVNAFMKTWVPRILRSPAFKKDGLLLITADESDSPLVDSTACCNEPPGPNTVKPGLVGPGGGLVGALAISRWTKPDSWSTTPYNHYALLASLAEIFRVKKIGMARQAGLDTFGLDVFNTNWYLK
jgi:phospholipase C